MPRNPKSTKKIAPAKAPVVEFKKPTVRFEPVIIPLGNGNFEIKSGKPIVTDAVDEISAPQFAEETGLSLRYVNELCDEGTIKSRRKSQKVKSHYVIPKSELVRFEQLQKAER